MEKVTTNASKLAVLLEMIQFKLTIFAMPFAFTGAILAAKGLPGLTTILLIVVAMVGARTAAMAFNRIVDRRFDAANPRTAQRAIPAGQVSLPEAWAMVSGSSALFFFACWQLNALTLKLAPLALGLTFFYSLTKRFTFLCHLILGLALAFSPLGGWAAVVGNLADYPFILSIGVMFWVAGFDAIYACLDADFDKQAGLFSLPAKMGRLGAFRLAGFFHLSAFFCFALTGYLCELNLIYYLGLLLAGGALFHQHRIVKPDDLSRIHASFFSMNGIVSVSLFVATCLSLATDSLL